MRPALLITPALIGLLAFTTWIQAGVVRVRSHVTVKGGLVTLGEIADLSEMPGEFRTQLEQVTLAPSPAAGNSLRLNTDLIRRELALRGIDQTSLQLTGASETHVTRFSSPRPAATVTVSQRTLDHTQRNLETLLRPYISKYAPELFSPQAAELQIGFDDQQLTRIANSKIELSRAQLRGGQRPWIGQQRFQLVSTAPGVPPASIEFICQLTQQPKALALKQSLARGQVIREGDLHWVTADSAGSHFDTVSELVGTETKRSIQANQPLSRDDVRQLPLIRRGDVVSVVAIAGSISVRRHCRSLDEGALNEFVALVPIDGKKKLIAQVTGLREATITVSPTTAISRTPELPARLYLNGDLPANQTLQPSIVQTSGTSLAPVPPGSPTPLPILQPHSPRQPHPTPQQHAEPTAPRNQPESIRPTYRGTILPNQPARLTP